MVGTSRSGGRNRLPSYTKLTKGTAKPSRMRAGEPRPPAGIPPAPPWLSEEGRRHYERIAQAASLLGAVSLADGEVLALAAQAAEELAAADAIVQKSGVLVWLDTKFGKALRRNPAIAVRDAAARRYHSLLRELGMGPQSRSAVSALAEPVESDPAEKYFLHS